MSMHIELGFPRATSEFVTVGCGDEIRELSAN